MTERSAEEGSLDTQQEQSGPSKDNFKTTSDGQIRPTGSEGKIDAEMTGKQPAQAASPNRSDPPSSIRSRLSRRSTGEEGSQHTNSAEKAVREQVEEEGLIRRTPFYRSPIPGQADRWHEEVNTPSQWTSLFYGTYHHV